MRKDSTTGASEDSTNCAIAHKGSNPWTESKTCTQAQRVHVLDYTKGQ